MKLFISSDMEGTTGIMAWEETDQAHPTYAHFALQMSREVAAACEGAQTAGVSEVLVKDAHNNARNINPELLPQCTKIFRGWGRTPLCMMAGLDKSFDGAFLTGYHSAAGMDTNPLSHTMNRQNNTVRVNGMLMPEAVISAMTASYFKVPTRMITGDRGICEYMQKLEPGIVTVPVSEGMGAGSISIHPDLAVQNIREAAARAMRKPKAECMFPLPDSFQVEICYKEHAKARWAAWYPGMKQVNEYTVSYEAKDFLDVLVMIHYIL